MAITEERVQAAYRAWRKAADRGYGDRDNSYSHMQKVDARIRKLKERYESLAMQRKAQNPRGKVGIKRDTWITGKVRVTKSGKIQVKVPRSAIKSK